MKYLYAPAVGLAISLLGLLSPIWMLIALPFIRWDQAPSTDRTGHTTLRGDLPDWLGWLSTPDERLPGGLYVPAHKKLLEYTNKWFASWVWLGVRNRLFGLSMACGKPASEYIPDVRGFYERGDVWQYSVQFGTLRFLTGYKVYKLLDGRFWAAPSFTLMVRR